MSKALVRLYPTTDAFITGVPAIEQDVTPERAAELLAYQPPAFTTDPPPITAAPSKPEDPPSGGSSDSEAP